MLDTLASGEPAQLTAHPGALFLAAVLWVFLAGPLAAARIFTTVQGSLRLARMPIWRSTRRTGSLPAPRLRKPQRRVRLPR
jgi:hypothetical protein